MIKFKKFLKLAIVATLCLALPWHIQAEQIAPEDIKTTRMLQD